MERITFNSEKVEAIDSLRKAIRGDRNLFVKAANDPNWSTLQHDVDALLENLIEEVKSQAKQEIAKTDSAIEKAEHWAFYKKATGYHTAKDFILEAKKHSQTESYFGYLDAIHLAKEACKAATIALKEQQKTVESAINKSLAIARDKVELYDPEGLTYSQIGRKVNIQWSNAAKALKTAQECLAREIGKTQWSPQGFSEVLAIAKKAQKAAEDLDNAAKPFLRAKWWREEFHNGLRHELTSHRGWKVFFLVLTLIALLINFSLKIMGGIVENIVVSFTEGGGFILLIWLIIGVVKAYKGANALWGRVDKNHNTGD